jgi:hypothetical protein
MNQFTARRLFMFECGYARSFCEYLKAGDPNATAEELKVLAGHADYRIRRRVAENPATPAETLQQLANDVDFDVRIAVGVNPATDTYVKLRLACDRDPTVRLGLAHEITMPLIVLHQLTHDENAWVAGQARRTLEIIEANKAMQPADIADFAWHKQRRKEADQSAQEAG